MDSRALSKLGVYIPKPDLNSFLIRDEFDGKVVISVTANNLNTVQLSESCLRINCAPLVALSPFLTLPLFSMCNNELEILCPRVFRVLGAERFKC